jgi:CO/xanthine dehydrogenase FAD-binding subunit
MRPKTFELFRPTTVDEAVVILATHAPDVRVLAGGQSLMPMMKLRLAAPERLVDLMKVTDLQGITREGDGTVVIGSMTTHDAVANSDLLLDYMPVLVEAATHIGDMQVRNRGTMGGSCCQFLSESDYPPVLTMLEAEFEVRGASGTRRVPAVDFFDSALVTAVKDGELLTAIRIPGLAPHTGGAHDKVSRRFNDFGLISGSALVTLDDSGRAIDVRIALGNAAPRPARVPSVEAALSGQVITDELVAAAVTRIGDDINPATDNHATADYRRKIAPSLVGRLVRTAILRAKGAQA